MKVVVNKIHVVYRPTVRCPSCMHVQIIGFNGEHSCSLCDFPFEVVGIGAQLNEYHSNPIEKS